MIAIRVLLDKLDGLWSIVARGRTPEHYAQAYERHEDQRTRWFGAGMSVWTIMMRGFMMVNGE